MNLKTSLMYAFLFSITLSTIIPSTSLVAPFVFAQSTATITVESVDMSGTAFEGQWVELWKDGMLLGEGFSPFSTAIDIDTPYDVFIYDDPNESKFFDHWDDGTTNPTRTIAIASDATITAFFNVDTTSPPTATITVESVDMSGTAFEGQWVELWKDGMLLGEGFSPFSTAIDIDTPYDVFIYDDPNESKFFDHWDDGTTNPTRTIAIASDATITAFFQIDTALPTTNNPPVANNDSIQTGMNTPVTHDVLANDFDTDDDTILVTSTSSPSDGVATINVDMTITYTPNQNFVGSDSFIYTISDGKEGTDTATVTVTVSGTTQIPTITKSFSGLIASDNLTEPRTFEELKQDQNDLWFFNGSAIGGFEPDAPFDFFQNSDGLHLGVQSPEQGAFAGIFGVTAPEESQLAHAKIIANQRTISSNFYNTGLFVQSSAVDLNFVTCVAITGTAGTTWHLFRTTAGNATQASGFEVLWSDTAVNQPLSRDCAIITNGDNALKLVMDGVKVYENSTLNLQMEKPFHVFLETQSSHTDNMLFGMFKDFYVTTNEFATITNLPDTASKIQLVDTNNNLILETSLINNGEVKIDISSLSFPVVANIKVFDSSNTEIATTDTLQNIYGGDVYNIAR